MRQKAINMTGGNSPIERTRYERPSIKMYEMEIESAVLTQSGEATREEYEAAGENEGWSQD